MNPNKHAFFAAICRTLTLVVASCSILSFAPSACGTTWIWNGGGGADGNWNNSANWFGLGIPANGDSVIFQGATGLNSTNNIANLTLGQIKFLNGGFNVYGSPFTLTNSIVSSNFTGNILISNSLTIATADVTLLTSNSISLTLKGNIGGSVGVVKSGQGTVIYNGPGNNGYTGTTLVSGGSLELNVGGTSAFGGPLVIGDDTGLNSPTVLHLRSNQVPDSVPITISVNATLNLNTFNETIGTNLTLNNGSISTGTGLLTLSPNATITVISNSSPSISGNINTGSGTLTMQGSGTINFFAAVSGTANIVQNDSVNSAWYGVNTYMGNFTVNAAGYVDLHTPQALGNTNNAMTLNGQSFVALNNVNITNQSLTINTTNTTTLGVSTFGTVYAYGGINNWQGNFILNSSCTVFPVSTVTLHLIGPISGLGGFMQIGGTLFLDGSSSNSYAGTTIVSNSAALMLNKTFFDGAIPGNLDIKSGGIVHYANDNQIINNGDVFVESGGIFDFAAFFDDINTLHGTGNVTFGSFGYLNIGQAGGTSKFDGLMSGIGFNGGYTVGKFGSGTFTMTGNNTFLNALYVAGGALIVDGNQPQNSLEYMTNGATLGGAGTVGSIYNNFLTVSGIISPGDNGPGILTCSNVTLTPSTTFKVQLTGPNPGVGGYDQLNVLGTNLITGATLAVIPAFATPVSVGQQFTIINNNLLGPVIGIFNGLPQASTFSVNNYTFAISYFGGTGNDVVLTLTSIPGSTVASAVASGNGSSGLDPNGCNYYSLVISNQTSSTMTGVSATLSTSNENVIVTQPSATYPNIPPHGLGTNTIPFQASILPSLVCGSSINFQLGVNSSLGSFSMSYTQASGERTAPLRYDVNGNTAIPDIGSVDSTNVVSGFTSTPLQKVAVSLYITHQFDADLTNISLISPDGTKVLLSLANGGSGQNYGSGLTPDSARTTFDDAGLTSITNGTAPFVGTFSPQSPLSAFAGNPTPNGNWHLHIADGFGGSLGTLRGWSLFLYGTGCSSGGGACALCAGGTTLTNTLTTSSSTNTLRLFRNTVASACGSAKAFPTTSAGSFNYHVYPFYNSSSNTCITVSLTSFGGDLFPSAYLGSFDPSNLAANYLADPGVSTAGATTVAFAFNVPPNTTFVVVVNNVGAPGTYTLNVSGGDCAPVLNIASAGAGNVDVKWPTVAGGYNLLAAPALPGAVWLGITNVPIASSNYFNVTNSIVKTNRFYRLQHP